MKQNLFFTKTDYFSCGKNCPNSKSEFPNEQNCGTFNLSLGP